MEESTYKCFNDGEDVKIIGSNENSEYECILKYKNYIEDALILTAFIHKKGKEDFEFIYEGYFHFSRVDNLAHRLIHLNEEELIDLVKQNLKQASFKLDENNCSININSLIEIRLKNCSSVEDILKKIEEKDKNLEETKKILEDTNKKLEECQKSLKTYESQKAFLESKPSFQMNQNLIGNVGHGGLFNK